jgi:hypothetical protein
MPLFHAEAGQHTEGLAVTDVSETYRRAIENIMQGMECPKAFACCQPGSEQPYAVRVLAGGKLLECLADTPPACKFAVDFGLGRFCECPLRAFLLRNPSGLKNGPA